MKPTTKSRVQAPVVLVLLEPVVVGYQYQYRFQRHKRKKMQNPQRRARRRVGYRLPAPHKSGHTQGSAQFPSSHSRLETSNNGGGRGPAATLTSSSVIRRRAEGWRRPEETWEEIQAARKREEARRLAEAVRIPRKQVVRRWVRRGAARVARVDRGAEE